MCRRAYCEQCQKLTFTGCGKHLDAVFRGVPESERCHCSELAMIAAAPVLAQVAPNAAAYDRLL